jgi:hypothetical protein
LLFLQGFPHILCSITMSVWLPILQVNFSAFFPKWEPLLGLCIKMMYTAVSLFQSSVHIIEWGGSYKSD